MLLNPDGRMVQNAYIRRVRAIHEERAQVLAGLKTAAKVRAWQEQVKRSVAGAFGRLPRRTPLKTRTTGIIQRRGYRIEKLIFESRPGCLVTANLYVPDGLKGRAPGALVPCGHSGVGKAEPLYQDACIRLALSGFVALIYDPYNQGERDQYADLNDRECVAGCCAAHNQMTKQLELVGQWFGMWRAWDGVRALDVLEARPEVDPARLALTGNSGGGTLSSWLWALDDRFAMAAPSCFITTFLYNLENEMPQDGEQYPPGLLGAGWDLGDWLGSRAPKPLLLLGQWYDYFDRRGLAEIHDELKAVYKVLGAGDKLAKFQDRKPHGFSAGNQLAMIEFFCRHAGLPKPTLPEPERLPVEELWATPTGSVIASGSRPVYRFFADEAERLRSRRPVLERTMLQRKLARLLNLPKRGGVPHYRVPRAVKFGEATIARYAVETEAGIECFLHHPVADPNQSHQLNVSGEVVVYVPDQASETDMLEQPLTRHLATQAALYAADPRGLGETMPYLLEWEKFTDSYGQDYLCHGFGLMLGESYLGRRVYDVLKAVDLLAAEGATRVHLAGRGQGAIIALLAGVLDDRLASVTLQHLPLSFERWTEAPITTWPSAASLRGILAVTDVAELLGACAGKVTVYDPWDERQRPLPAAAVPPAILERGIVPRPFAAS